MLLCCNPLVNHLRDSISVKRKGNMAFELKFVQPTSRGGRESRSATVELLSALPSALVYAGLARGHHNRMVTMHFADGR